MLVDVNIGYTVHPAIRSVEIANGSLCLNWPQQMSDAPPAYMGLLGWRPLESTIKGFVVEVVGPASRSIKAMWHFPVVRSPDTPLALWPGTFSELADITLDDSTQTCGTILDIMRALLLADGTVESARQERQPPSARSANAGLRQLAGWPAHIRYAVAVEIGGPMLPVLELLARQRLLEQIGGLRSSWRSVLREYQELDAKGRGAYLPIRLWGSRAWPSHRLQSRLEFINSQPLLDAFVRVSVAISTDRERCLFEQSLTNLLRQVFVDRRQLGLNESQMASEAWSLLVSIAERTAFLQYRVSASTQDETAPMFMSLSMPFAPLSRSVRSTPFQRPAHTRRLLALVRRWSQEMLSRLQRDQFDVRPFLQECNQIVPAVVAGAWRIVDLSERKWEELFALDAGAGQREVVELPDLNWPVEVPERGQSCLDAAGMVASPLACTADLLLEADEMQNCLASSRVYFDGLAAGELRIFAIRGLVRATMAFAFERDAWELTEICDDEGRDLNPELLALDAPEWMALHRFAGHVANLPGPTDVGVDRGVSNGLG
jgi:hypothetical protein